MDERKETPRSEYERQLESLVTVFISQWKEKLRNPSLMDESSVDEMLQLRRELIDVSELMSGRYASVSSPEFTRTINGALDMCNKSLNGERGHQGWKFF